MMGVLFQFRLSGKAALELLLRDLNKMKEEARNKEQQVQTFLNWEHS